MTYPQIYLFPLSPTEARLSAMLPKAWNSFEWHTHTCPLAEVPKLLADYYSDPEKVLRELFSWTPLTQGPVKTKIDLKELGL